MSAVFAKAGDKVTCPNGHPICTVAADLLKGEIVKSSLFKDWTFDLDLSSGAKVPPCPTCGEIFMGHPDKAFPVRGKVFVNGEWRPK